MRKNPDIYNAISQAVQKWKSKNNSERNEVIETIMEHIPQ